jgi:hypothetical protein
VRVASTTVTPRAVIGRSYAHGGDDRDTDQVDVECAASRFPVDELPRGDRLE